MSSTLITLTHPLTTQEAARHLIQDAHEVDEEIRSAKQRAANAAAVLRARGVAVGNGKALAMSELISKTAAGEAPRALGAKLARAMREKVLGLGGGVAAGIVGHLLPLGQRRRLVNRQPPAGPRRFRPTRPIPGAGRRKRDERS